MKVTDQEYAMEKLLVQKLDLMCARVSGKRKLQNVIGCDGEEGFGKTTITAGAAYYMAHKLNRPLLLFFDIEALMKHALTHEDHIYIWDDAAYAGLSVQAYSSKMIKFIKTILLARKKRHTYFINIQEIWRLKEMLVSRMVGLMHVYSQDELTLGRFTYYKKDALRIMYDVWIRQRKKQYKRWMTFKGGFSNALYKIFDEKEYEDLKDQTLLSIPDDNTNQKRGKYLMKYRKLLGIMSKDIPLTLEEQSKKYNIAQSTLESFRYSNRNEDGKGFTPREQDTLNNKELFVEPKTDHYINNIKQDYSKDKPLKGDPGYDAWDDMTDDE